MIRTRCGAMAAALLLAPVCADASRVLILSTAAHPDTGGSTAHLRALLESSGKFEISVNEEAEGIAASTLAGYDAVVLNAVRPSAVVEAFVRGGKGAVVLHAGGACGARRLYRVKVASGHVVTDGLDPAFTTSDQVVRNGSMPEGARVLAVAKEDSEYGGTGFETPVAWTVVSGKGHMFATTLGHDLGATQEHGFEAMFVRAVEWAATGDVKLAARPAPAIRALVVTGGHSYETSFYTVFDQPRLVWTHAVNNAEAFRRDLRGQYDVLVLYNMTDEIAEAGRKNLVDFIEAGKGVVVLHHAVFSFRDWEWWREEVTGTRPMPADRRPPGPGYVHDADLVIESGEPHPITEGLAPMHIIDETYATLEFSPGARVLLKTRHPTSNGPVVWIGPHGKSRVVSIQLGHDHTSHLHGGFRTLVERAIRWSAGRL